jgi:putative ABC transport system permease protein
METLLRDLRYALRSLLQRPALFAVATLSLALGISANTTIFAAIDAYLIRPLPYPEPDGLFQFWTTNPERGWRRASSSLLDLTDYQAGSSRAELAGYSGGSFNLSGTERPERISGTRVTAGFFQVLGVRPLRGRTFLPEEGAQGAARVVVLSHDYWMQHLAGDSAILGRALLLDGAPHTVVGIMPKGFAYPSPATQMWTTLQRTGREARQERFLQIVGRVRSGSTLDQARAELAGIAERLSRSYVEDAGNGVSVLRLDRAIYNDEFHRGATISMVAVVFVLLIACANVANLLLARATGRARELALRTALGAGRGRLIRQLLTESVVLALAGGVLGTILSIWGVKAFVSIIPPDFFRTETISLDGRALAFTLVIAVGCGIMFGLAPALQGTSANISGTLREGGRSASMGVRRNRLGAALVVAEISLALVLLISAGLLIKGSIQLQRVDLGFVPEGVLTARVSVPEMQYPDSTRVTAFHSELLRRLREVPGVQSVGAAMNLPLQGGSGIAYSVEGEAKPEKGKEPIALFNAITPGYLESMSIRLLEGRAFTDGDRSGTPLVALVNETFAKRHWPDGDPIGKRIEVGTSGVREVVGLVHDSRDFGPDDDPPLMIYLPAFQRVQRGLAYTIRSDQPPAVVTSAVREALAKLDPTLPLFSVQTMGEVIELEQRGEHIMPRLLTTFGAVALVLAIMGVYGVMSYSVSQRTQEMGVRMALGASRGDIVRLVLRQGGLLAGIGLVVGLGLAALTTRTLSVFLLGVSAYDPTIFAGVSAALVAAALAASLVPAGRAVKVDPLVALRND